MLLYSMMCDFFLMCWLTAVLFTMPTHPRVGRNKRGVDTRVMTNPAVSAQKTNDSCASSVEDNDSSVNMASGGYKRKFNELESGEWISVKSYTLRFISEIRFSLNFAKGTFNLLNESPVSKGALELSPSLEWKPKHQKM